MEINKIKTYVSFAKKSRKILYGVDDTIKSKKCKLICFSDDLADNSAKKLENFASSYKIQIIKLEKNFYLEVIDNISIKSFAIVDENLADAIKKEFAK